MQAEFKVFYAGKAATKEQLDRIEEIVVEQEIDKAWEARIKIPVCIAEDGSWEGEDDAAYAEFARVRVEARIGEGEFVPLIEGSIWAQEPDYNAGPGLSAVTLIVHDDSKKLHRKTKSESYAGQDDGKVVRSIFSAAELGEGPDVDNPPAGPAGHAVLNQPGTMMEMLRSIADRYGNYHAYVLPGATAGKSKGCFKKLPTKPDSGLPIAYLSGPDRNLSEFRIQRNSGRAAKVEGAHLDMSDKKVTTASAGPNDNQSPSNEGATTGQADDLRLRRLQPGIGDHTDLTEAVKGMAEESGYTLSAEGSVIPGVFSAILSPYKMLAVRLSNSRYSTGYVITKVVHTLGISQYSQSFNVIGNTVSIKNGAGPDVPQASASLTASFNVQVSIF